MGIEVKNKYINKFLNDRNYRSKMIFHISVIITIAFAIFNGVLGISYLSIWYGSIAIYYIALSFQRLFVFIYRKNLMNKNYNEDLLKEKENNLYFINGIITITLIFALSFSIAQMVLSNKPVISGKIIAITIATYSFVKITMSIINLIKDTKLNDKIAMTIRNINFVDALVSILSLSVTLLTTFGKDKDWSLMITLIGTGISLCIVAIGVFMIIISKKR